MYACLAVTCHLHFWQNDRDFLRATVVTRGWNGYRNKSQHRKSTLEKKILPPFQQGFEPATFQSRVRCSNHWAIPAPHPTLSVPNITYDLCGYKTTIKEAEEEGAERPKRNECKRIRGDHRNTRESKHKLKLEFIWLGLFYFIFLAILALFSETFCIKHAIVSVNQFQKKEKID